MRWLRICTVVTLTTIFLCGTGRAQQATLDSNDIKAALAKIDGTDPVQRVLDAQSIMQSNNSLLRSLALEKILQSDDGRVREVGLLYLLTVQQQFVVTIDTTQNTLNGPQITSDTALSLQQRTPLLVQIGSVDQNTNEFSATVNSASAESGTVTQDGFSILMAAESPLRVNTTQDGPYLPCELQFRGYANGFMRGAVVCGPYSFPASTPLP